ncbi:MAG: pyridoxal phosphate-dependent aminotransferase [Bacteroidales bacterium]|nr:pyridoxal phosphate-dependent aminotransferase [Bacteroidales bacterium]
MTRKSRELQAQGHKVINMSIGQPDFFTPNYIKEAAKKAIDDNFTFYPPVAGFKELREAIADKFKRDNGLDYDCSQVVVSTGAKQALANVVLSLVNPGDEVVVPVPYWVSYREIIKLAEGKAVFLPTSIESDYKITPAQLEKAITNKTKLFIFSSPCNPSGSVYTKDELKALADVFARHKDVFVISDEIYEHINFEAKHESIAQFYPIKDQVIIVNGVSKGFAMTGWRLGYIAAPEAIAKACDKLQGQVTSGANTIAQQAALAAVSQDPDKSEDMKQMRNAFLERRDVLIKLLKEIPGMKVNVPKGAFYLFPDISHYFGKSDGETTINDSFDLAEYVLEKAHVAIVPGSAFGSPECVRLSYAASVEEITEAANRLKEKLGRLR